MRYLITKQPDGFYSIWDSEKNEFTTKNLRSGQVLFVLTKMEDDRVCKILQTLKTDDGDGIDGAIRYSDCEAMLECGGLARMGVVHEDDIESIKNNAIKRIKELDDESDFVAGCKMLLASVKNGSHKHKSITLNVYRNLMGWAENNNIDISKYSFKSEMSSSSVRISYLDKKKDKGITFLKKRSNLWLWQYIPNIGKEIKIEGSMLNDPWVGSDLSNDEEKYKIQLTPKKIEGRDGIKKLKEKLYTNTRSEEDELKAHEDIVSRLMQRTISRKNNETPSKNYINTGGAVIDNHKIQKDYEINGSWLTKNITEPVMHDDIKGINGC